MKALHEGAHVEEQFNPGNTGGDNHKVADQKQSRKAEAIETLRRSDFNKELTLPRASNDLAIQTRFEFGMRNHMRLDDINRWLKFPNVTPRDAALVLCMQDAITDNGQEPVKFISGVGCRDFKWMLKTFEGMAEHEKQSGSGQARALLDWRDLARERRLKYHSWFDRYEQPSALTTKAITQAPSGHEEHDQTVRAATTTQPFTPAELPVSAESRPDASEKAQPPASAATFADNNGGLAALVVPANLLSSVTPQETLLETDGDPQKTSEQGDCAKLEEIKKAAPTETPVTSGAPGKGESTASRISTHALTKRTNILDAVISIAKSKAAAPDDAQSHWAALVLLANLAERPAPLLGFVDGEGVKYQGDDGVAFLTKRNFLRRRNAAKSV